MTTNWPELTNELSADLKNLRGGVPDVMKAFSNIAEAALAPKALDAKTKELLALAISVAVRCDDCIAFHAKAAVQHGASRGEILENSRHGDLHGRGAIRHVCEPCPRRLRRVRRSQGQRAVALSRGLSNALKWKLWHGQVHRAISALDRIVVDMDRLGQNGDFSAARLHSLGEQLLTYIRSNRYAIVDYGARYRSGRRIATNLASSQPSRMRLAKTEYKSPPPEARATARRSPTSLRDWLFCAGVASSALWLRELSKIVARANDR